MRGTEWREFQLQLDSGNLSEAPKNHWVSFQLEGVKCNRLALNARARVTAGDLVQLDEVRSGGSYLSQNDLRLHFGLGKHERVDKAEILWPDGSVEPLTSLVADHFYIVRQGAGVVSSKARYALERKQNFLKNGALTCL